MKHLLNQTQIKGNDYFSYPLCVLASLRSLRKNNCMKKKILLTVLTAFIFAGISQAQEISQSKNLKEYTGRYVFPANDMGEDLIIELNSDTLTAIASIGSTKLKFIDGESFGIPQYGGLLEFIRNETTGQIIGIKVSIPMGGIDMEGTKKIIEITEQK